MAVPAFAQSQPAATGGTAATAPAAPAAVTTAQADTGATGNTAGATAGTTGTTGANGAAAAGTTEKNVKQLKTFQVTGSLIRQSDKTGFQQVQVVSQKDIQASGATTVSDFLRSTAAN